MRFSALSVAFALAPVAATLAKLAFDACLFSSQNFGFVSLPKECTTGSSIMPHKKNPDVTVKIEQFSWSEFNTKWTTGLTSGQVPDISTALPNNVVEMINSEALVPLDKVIDSIGRDRFPKPALAEGQSDGKSYSVPIYSHAQVMWYRKDVLSAKGLSVPKTWEELAKAAKAIGKSDSLYGLSVPLGTGDMLPVAKRRVFTEPRSSSR